MDIWQPPYAAKPGADERFIPREVEAVIKDVLDRKLRSAEYDDARSRSMALELCEDVKQRVKELNIPRYKLVLQAVIGEVKGQGAYIASRCLWDSNTDCYASFSMKNSSLFCVLMVFGLYLE